MSNSNTDVDVAGAGAEQMSRVFSQFFHPEAILVQQSGKPLTQEFYVDVLCFMASRFAVTDLQLLSVDDCVVFGQ